MRTLKCSKCKAKLTEIEHSYCIVYYITDLIDLQSLDEKELEKEFLDAYDEAFHCPYCGAELDSDRVYEFLKKRSIEKICECE
jgi:hypothetical protein